MYFNINILINNFMNKAELKLCLMGKLNKNREYTIFYTKDCPYSMNALELLRNSNVEYKGYDIYSITGGKDFLLECLRELNLDKDSIERLNRHTTRPIIFYKKRFIGGFTELKNFIKH